MATNYRANEVAEVLKEGTDAAAVKDIMQRYPFLSLALLKVGVSESLVELLEGIPEHITARQLNSRLGGSGDGESETKKEPEKKEPEKKDAKKPDAKDAKKGGSKKDTKKDDDDDWGDGEEEADFSKMNNAELKAAIKERGLKMDKGSREDAIKILQKYEADKAKKAKKGENKKEEKSDDDEWDV